MQKRQIKARLLQRRDVLTGEIEDRAEEISDVKIDEEEDRIVERLEEEVLSALSAADRDEVRRIELALEKLDEGSYGLCEECGEKIAPARLEAMPDALVCIDCASKAELRSM